tara:strand:+ start:2377 stop:2709 length:333 start_codon:yes stop_codon:yes gene_type:complete
MTEHLKLRIHITEPWDFMRQTGLEELTGWTTDHEIEELEEWELMLDAGYKMHDVMHHRVLISPRYVGEHLARIFDAIVGFPVRIAHRLDGEWHYALAGMLTVRREKEEEL